MWLRFPASQIVPDLQTRGLASIATHLCSASSGLCGVTVPAGGLGMGMFLESRNHKGCLVNSLGPERVRHWEALPAAGDAEPNPVFPGLCCSTLG